MVAQGFSYGPSPVIYGDIAGSPQGGAAADLFGFGFSADVAGAAINVGMGGQTAHVTQANEGDYELSLQHLQVTLPAGSPGAHDITITTPTGTSTISSGFHTLESVEDYPTSDTLLDILYDESRQELDLSAGNHVDVFSLTTHTFLPAITPPSVGANRQLEGLALTPDGSKLLVANSSDNSVAVIDPDSPSAATAVTIVPPGSFASPQPYQIAATNQGTAFIATSSGGVFVLNLSTLQSSADTDPSLFWASSELGDWIARSRDGSEVCINNVGVTAGTAEVWTAATNTWVAQHSFPNSLLDCSVSGDGNVLSVLSDGYDTNAISFVDSQGNILGAGGLPAFRAVMDDAPLSSYLQGARLNDGGSLLYLPFPQGVDIFDVQHGNLRERISLTERMSYGIAGNIATLIIHSMAIDETGQHIFLITSKGVTVVELDSVPLSMGSVTPATGPSGTQVKVRGSGFLEGITASANGVAAAVSYVDADTLQVTLPSLPAGAVQITLTNLDGQSYSLDDAYTAQ